MLIQKLASQFLYPTRGSSRGRRRSSKSLVFNWFNSLENSLIDIKLTCWTFSTSQLLNRKNPPNYRRIFLVHLGSVSAEEIRVLYSSEWETECERIKKVRTSWSLSLSFSFWLFVPRKGFASQFLYSFEGRVAKATKKFKKFGV